MTEKEFAAEVNDFEAEFHKIQQEYKSKFGDILPTEEMPPDDLENIMEIVRECIRTDTPYKAHELPNDCIS